MSALDIAHADWRKSSRSNDTQACVEVALTTAVAGVRDSKNPAGGALVVPTAAWAVFRDNVVT